MAEEEKKTSDEWLKMLNENEENKGEPKTKILDPDGWDRSNFDHSFYEEEVTEEEFTKRLNFSTIKKVPPKKNKDLKSIEEHNKEKLDKNRNKVQKPKTGIACPQCGSELVEDQVGPMNTILPTHPPKKPVKCEDCGYATSVFA